MRGSSGSTSTCRPLPPRSTGTPARPRQQHVAPAWRAGRRGVSGHFIAAPYGWAGSVAARRPVVRRRRPSAPAAARRAREPNCAPPGLRRSSRAGRSRSTPAPQRVVGRGEAAGDAFGQDELAGDDAVASSRAAPSPAPGRRIVVAAEEAAGQDQRPWTGGGRRAGATRRSAARPARAATRPGWPWLRRAKRRVGVVGGLARPDEVPPEAVLGLLGGEAGESVSRSVKKQGRPASAADGQVTRLGRLLAAPRWPADQRRVVAEVVRDAPGPAAQSPSSAPHDLAQGASWSIHAGE